LLPWSNDQTATTRNPGRAIRIISESRPLVAVDVPCCESEFLETEVRALFVP
jgi:hypothetical protein